jgi:predicted nucleotidyltransferase
MERRSVETIIRALNDTGVRYLIAGGLAVVAHGYVRFTADVDLLLDMNEANLRRAIAALSKLGYRPRAPVEFADYADEATRARWAREKGLTVFSVYSGDHPATEVDLFLEAVIDFDRAFGGAKRLEVAPGVTATFVGLPDLIAMKRMAGRPQDREDIERLAALPGPSGAES